MVPALTVLLDSDSLFMILSQTLKMWINFLSVVGILCSLSDDTQIEIIKYSNNTCVVGCVKGMWKSWP
jgi:hypothetical protein